MKIAIFGCGNMGMSYAHSFLKYNLVNRESLLLIEKDIQRREHLEKLNIGKVINELGDSSFEGYDVIILAVKPQDFVSISNSLAKSISPGNTILSIMAGKTIRNISDALNHKKIVRAMPNSPALVGMGITAYAVADEVDMQSLRKVENLLNTTGRSVLLEDESLLDAVTALSGSGPAYFYYIVKSMIDAGMQMGMDEATASILVKQTMIGSYYLINDAQKSLDDLIKAVASKGGTTEAALSHFNSEHLDEIIKAGIFKAEKRAGELSK